MATLYENKFYAFTLESTDLGINGIVAKKEINPGKLVTITVNLNPSGNLPFFKHTVLNLGLTGKQEKLLHCRY